jgi:anti-sigma B factor antagonist
MATQAIFTVEQPTIDVMVLGGEVDLSNAASVKSLLDEWLKMNLATYTLDLRPLKLIDSSGLGLVVGAYRRASLQQEPKAQFEVLASGNVLSVIQLIGLDKVIPVKMTEE